MIREITIWIVAVPVLLTAAILLAGWRPWRRHATTDDTPEKGAWVAALAVALSYSAANWGITGGPTGSDPLNARLLYVAAGGLILGVLEGWSPLPTVARWALRVLAAFLAAWLILGPLAAPQKWSAGQTAFWIAVVAGATLVAWSSLDDLAQRESGSSLALALAILGTGGSLVIVFSDLASTGQLVGALVAALGVSVLILWKWPARGRLVSAIPTIALVLVGHFTIGLFYAEMPGLSFALLVVTAPVLLLTRLRAVTRLTALVALLLRLLAVGAPVGLAVTTAALKYFEPTPSAADSNTAGKSGDDKSPSATGDDDDYGYD